MVRPGVVVASTALALSLAAGPAHAQPTRKVTVESDPPGAHVYLNAKEDGIACEATPCTIDVPLGETPLIVELENYAPSITMLDVGKGRGALKQSIKLVPAGGGINAKALPGVKVASVKVDDVDKGVAPLRIPVDPGPHHVVYLADGKQVYEEYIEVEASPDYYELSPHAAATPPGPSEGSDDADLATAIGSGEVHATAPAAARPPIAVLSLLFDIAFRQFSYDNGTGKDTRPESESGQVLLGPLIELYPTALFAPKTLPGLALLVRFEYGVHSQAVGGVGFMESPTTFWQSIEVSLRNRWHVGDSALIDASGGYVQDQLQFNGKDMDLQLVPDANYQAVRLGLRGALRSGDLEPYVAIENRIVFSSGTLGTRYAHASTNGIHAALGVIYRHGALSGRLEGQLTRYGSTFTDTSTNTLYAATGASDLVEVISLSAGYTY